MIVFIKSVNITGPGAGAGDHISVITNVKRATITKGIKRMRKRNINDLLFELIAWAIVWATIFAGCILTYILK